MRDHGTGDPKAQYQHVTVGAAVAPAKSLWLAKAILNPAHQEVAGRTMASPGWDADQVVDMLSDLEDSDDDLGKPMCPCGDINFPNPESDEERYYFSLYIIIP